ncbi:hypothetical protein M0R19_02760 [Candidatus Pacearchaeota archaeon]|jgi:hypothetical protein|nr:hypothetical protein [Candidatus Pacearchaeota archaeon]
MTELNKERIKEELIYIYKNFLKDNYNREMIRRAIEMDRLYGGAVQLLDEDLGNAINLLTFVIQEKMPGGKNKKEEIKKILEELEKS